MPPAVADTNRPRSLTDSLDQSIPGAFPANTAQTSSTQQSLLQAVHARRAEYTKPREIRIKVGTWNVASFRGTEKDIGGWFVDGRGVTEALAGLAVTALNDESHNGENTSGRVSLDNNETEGVIQQEARSTRKESTLPKGDPGLVPGGEEIGLYAIGLQEIVDINSPAEALRPYTDPTTANKFKSALHNALPSGYQPVAEQQLIGLLLLIYASPSVFPEVKSVSTTSVGTGLMGYMGNKGAVTTRLVLGETTRLVFVNCHLAAGVERGALERRNWDAQQIMVRTRFDPIVDSLGVIQATGERIGDEDFAFWFGDLNYRLVGMPGDDVRRLLMLHTRNEYDIGRYSTSRDGGQRAESASSTRSQDGKDAENTSVGSSISTSPTSTSNSDDRSSQKDEDSTTLDPTSLQATISSLLPHDELHEQMNTRKAFYDGWREGRIHFMPTYKYDVGTVGIFDSSEKRRCPSWCDRILYRTRREKLAFDARIQEEGVARKRDEEMKARGMDKASEDEDVLFDYDPDKDGDGYDEFADTEPEAVTTKEGFEDEISLEYYTSHQRVLSSDHKPLTAVFGLKYEAVVPDLKAKVHQEVARELDRAENEGRPNITLIVDPIHGRSGAESTDDDAEPFEGVNFGSVRYADTKRRTITIANTGRVPATIHFVDRPVGQGQSAGVTPRWLSIRFDRDPDPPKTGRSDVYTIEPGDTCSVELTLQVNGIDHVRSLNAGSSTLEDILVLRVENGPDHFLPVRSRWLHSSFGHSIGKLIRIPEGGIRKLQHQRPNAGGGRDGGEADAVMWSAPRELFRLTESVEDLVERSIAEWDMTGHDGEKAPWEAHAGWPFIEESWVLMDRSKREALKSKVHEALDCDESFDSAFEAETPALHRVEILAETLLHFLHSLQDGVVTEGLWTKLEHDMAARERAKQRLSLEDERTSTLEVLSSAPAHNISFVLLTSMLARVANEIRSTFKPSETPRTSAEVPTPSKVAARKGTLSKDPAVARRQMVERSLAAIFAEAVIRVPDRSHTKEKERKASEERRVRVVEVFVTGGDTVV